MSATLHDAVGRVPIFWILGLRWLRCPTKSAREHRAMQIAENCLRPWLLDGDVVFVDDTTTAQDGDLVLVRMVYESTRRFGFVLGGGPPARTTRNAIKQLRIKDGVRYLTCADGSMLADDHKEICGVVVAAWRRQWWKRPKLREISFAIETDEKRPGRAGPFVPSLASEGGSVVIHEIGDSRQVSVRRPT